MLHPNTLRNSFYVALGLVILTLTGIFNSFARRFVIEGQLSLATTLLLAALFGAGYMAAAQINRTARNRVGSAIINGVVASLVVGAALALVVVVTTNLDVSFVFRNLGSMERSPLTFGQDALATGLVMLLGVGAVMGVLAGLFAQFPPDLRNALAISAAVTVILGILQSQIDSIIVFSDSLSLNLVFVAAYLVGTRLMHTWQRGLAGGALGLAAAVVLILIASNGGLEQGGLLRGAGRVPAILGLARAGVIADLAALAVIFTVTGALGGIVAAAPGNLHSGAWYIAGAVLVLGILNWQGEMTPLATLLIITVLTALLMFLPRVLPTVEARFRTLAPDGQQRTRRFMVAVVFVILLVVPGFAGQYITSVLDLMMMYIIMGIGLNVMVGYAGLLDLGYVASFAIGAYTVGILTTPSLLTCGGLTPDQIAEQGKTLAEACTGILNFWAAWPFAVLFSALAGMALGVPVLRLRGDYLAIVTLGFGEIINRLILSNTFKPLLGGAQGISPIPSPRLDLTALNPAWDISFGSANNVYYLFLFGVVAAAAVVLRLTNTRLGRAWRAMREDEDVAEAMGIHLVNTKLLAFGISSAFAGLGGAVFGAWLQGIFPNSFTLLVSINVLSLIIIGGMGSIPGVIIGALMLIGLPEVLRELQDYRLLAFGVLLVIAMLVKPEGLLPPRPPRLTERFQGQNVLE